MPTTCSPSCNRAPASPTRRSSSPPTRPSAKRAVSWSAQTAASASTRLAVNPDVTKVLAGTTVGQPVTAQLSTLTAVVMMRPYDDLLPESQARIASASVTDDSGRHDGRQHAGVRRPALRQMGSGFRFGRTAHLVMSGQAERHDRRVGPGRTGVRHPADDRRDRSIVASFPAHHPTSVGSARPIGNVVRRDLRIGRNVPRCVRRDHRASRCRGERTRRGAVRRSRVPIGAGTKCAPPAFRRRIECIVLPAMSFLDVAFARLGIDPVEAAVRLIDGHEFATAAAGDTRADVRRPHARQLGAERHQVGRRCGHRRRTGGHPAAPRHARRAHHPHHVGRARPHRRGRSPHVHLHPRTSARPWVVRW